MDAPAPMERNTTLPPNDHTGTESLPPSNASIEQARVEP